MARGDRSDETRRAIADQLPFSDAAVQRFNAGMTIVICASAAGIAYWYERPSEVVGRGPPARRAQGPYRAPEGVVPGRPDERV